MGSVNKVLYCIVLYCNCIIHTTRGRILDVKRPFLTPNKCSNCMSNYISSVFSYQFNMHFAKKHTNFVTAFLTIIDGFL